MSAILEDYLMIYRKFPPNAPLGKAQRKQRHMALMAWKKRDYGEAIAMKAIIAFLEENSDLKFEQPFCAKVLVPCVLQELAKGEIGALRFLFACMENRADYCGTTNDYIVIFCQETQSVYNPFQLAELVLAKEPGNKTVLRYQYQQLRRWIGFSLHELPWGVLNGMDFASASALSEMLNDVEVFEKISQLLSYDEQALIDSTRLYYSAWARYLVDTEKYRDFADYLDQQGTVY